MQTHEKHFCVSTDTGVVFCPCSLTCNFSYFLSVTETFYAICNIYIVLFCSFALQMPPEVSKKATRCEYKILTFNHCIWSFNSVSLLANLTSC